MPLLRPDCAPESLSYEGEAACRLEALAASCPASATRLRCLGATTRWI